MRDLDVFSRSGTRDHKSTGRPLRIVVALDGTPFAEMALPPAVALGRTCHSEVVLVRAHMSRAGTVRTRLGLRRHERETLGRASLYLARIEHDLRTKGVRAVGMSPVGRTADAIADVASQDGDLVIVATHAGQVSSAQVSVARELATRVAVPLLLVPLTARGLFTPSAGSPTMVVALDGERCDTFVLRLVSSLAVSFGGRLLAVGAMHNADRVHAEGGPRGLVAHEHEAERVTAYLETVRANLARREVAAWTAVVESDPIEAVAELARAEGSLVALGVHGTLAYREATVEAAMALLRTTGSAVLLVPQGPLLSALPGRLPAPLTRGGLR